MNDARRKQLEAASKLISEAQSIIEHCRDEEQDAFDNMPEGLQQGDKGQAMELAVSTLDDAVNSCEEAVSSIEEGASASP